MYIIRIYRYIRYCAVHIVVQVYNGCTPVRCTMLLRYDNSICFLRYIICHGVLPDKLLYLADRSSSTLELNHLAQWRNFLGDACGPDVVQRLGGTSAKRLGQGGLQPALQNLESRLQSVWHVHGS